MLGLIAAMFVVFVACATLWRHRFAHGPFEAALRVFDPFS
jgi:uncharacterized membrane protein YeiB